jgi:hypothetical protein
MVDLRSSSLTKSRLVIVSWLSSSRCESGLACGSGGIGGAIFVFGVGVGVGLDVCC